MAAQCAHTKQRNAYAISLFENPVWVWFSIPKSVTTLLGIGIIAYRRVVRHVPRGTWQFVVSAQELAHFPLESWSPA